CRLERHGRFLAASRATGLSFHSFTRHPATGGTRGAPAPSAFAPFWLVLEFLVGEKLLLSRRPDELGTAVHATQDPVLELHRSLPRPGRSIPMRAATSCDCACARALALPFVCPQVSNRRNAS